MWHIRGEQNMFYSGINPLLDLGPSQFKDVVSHVKDKTVSRQSYFNMEIQYMGRTVFILKRGPADVLTYLALTTTGHTPLQNCLRHTQAK